MADNSGQITQAVLANPMAGATQGLQQGIGLAQTYQDMQAKQVKQQEMQQQLDDMKFKALTGRIQTQLAINDPNIAKQVAEQNEKAKVAAPGFFTSLHKSDEMQQGWRSALDYAAGNPLTDDEKRAAVATVADPTTFGAVHEMFNERTKTDAMKAALQMKLQNQQAVTASKNQNNLETAEIRAGGMNARAQNAASNNYDRSIGKSEDAIFQANRASEIINKIQSGDLKSTKTLSADLDAAQASLLGGGKPSTVYGQQAVHMDDLYSRSQNAIQFLSANPQDTQAPAKLEQLKKDINALSNFYADQHAQKYNAWRQTVPDKMRGAFDNRYKMFRKQQGMQAPIHEVDDEQAAPAQGGNAMSAFEQQLRNSVKADGSKPTEDEIQQALKRHGGAQ